MDEATGRHLSEVNAGSDESGAAEARPAPRRDDEATGRGHHPLVELTLTRLREFLREKEAVFWVFVFPVLLAFALGIAFRNTPPEKQRIAVEKSGAGAADATASEVFRVLAASSEVEPLLLSPAEARQQLHSGKVSMIVRPRAAASEANQGRENNEQGTAGGATAEAQARGGSAATSALTGELDYQYDPTRPESKVARMAVDDALQRALGRTDVMIARDQKTTEPGARYIDFLIPGLIGLNLLGSGMWGLGFAVVQARGRKLLKRFAATPMRRSHYLLSFMFSRLIFLSLEVIALVAFGWLVFGVAVRGSVLSVALISLLGGLTFSGLGMLVAARPETIEGVSGLMNFVMLPMWLLSGTFFSSARFPEFFQPFIKALPLTALNDSLRSVMNDGASLASNWGALVVLLVWCLLSFAVALKIFRWQ
ncbi:MAG: type transport system permease protein [Blastocatellia bacterium]|jgi:ABC-type multidrug transport system permease subunit|nr:type transport system permease protein [Blastocatellia bacterium]